MISILSECALTSIIEVDEPIEITSILPKCKKLLPIMEVDETADLASIVKAAAATTIQALIRGALARSALARREEAPTSTNLNDEEFLWDDEFSQPHSAEADDDIDFGHADEPLLDLDAIPEATPEPFQSPKKLQCCRCKAVESSLDGHYWSVSSTRRRRKSSRVRRQPDFFTPS